MPCWVPYSTTEASSEETSAREPSFRHGRAVFSKAESPQPMGDTGNLTPFLEQPWGPLMSQLWQVGRLGWSTRRRGCWFDLTVVACGSQGEVREEGRVSCPPSAVGRNKKVCTAIIFPVTVLTKTQKWGQVGTLLSRNFRSQIGSPAFFP